MPINRHTIYDEPVWLLLKMGCNSPLTLVLIACQVISTPAFKWSDLGL